MCLFNIRIHKSLYLKITQEDIQKSFGGGSSKAYYSSVYSSSTNAYMLMYRQIDEKRNEKSIKASDFPDHIKVLAEKLKEEEEMKISRGNIRHRPITDLTLPEQIKPRVYFYNPRLKKLVMMRIYVSQKFDIKNVLESAHQLLSVENFAPLSHCRLVGYDPPSEQIIRSFENMKDPTLEEIQGSSEDPVEFLLEYRADGQEFEIYEPGGATWYVFMVNLSTMEMDGPFFVYSKAFENNDTLRHSIAVRLHLKEEHLLVAVTQRYRKAFVSYDPMPTKEAQQQLQELTRTRFKNIIYFYLSVPNTDASNLEIMGIPVSEVNQELIQATCNNTSQLPPTNSNNNNSLPNGFNESALSTVGHESNSEDSSLSDGDRTLVENIKHRGDGDSQISSTSHSPQLSSPEEENRQESINRINAFYNGYSHGEPDLSPVVPQTAQFFHAIKLEGVDISSTIVSRHYVDPDSIDEAPRKPSTSYKILVDSHMKLSMLKTHVQRLIQVPENYFQLSRKHDKSLKNVMSQTLVYFSEGETLTVELGKELQPDEHKAKIYFMRLSELNNETGRLPCICEWIFTHSTTVAAAKASLVSKLHRIDNIKYKSLNIENCRLWLKGGRRLIKILSDDETLGSDIRSTAAMEV